MQSGTTPCPLCVTWPLPQSLSSRAWRSQSASCNRRCDAATFRIEQHLTPPVLPFSGAARRARSMHTLTIAAAPRSRTKQRRCGRNSACRRPCATPDFSQQVTYLPRASFDTSRWIHAERPSDSRYILSQTLALTHAHCALCTAHCVRVRVHTRLSVAAQIRPALTSRSRAKRRQRASTFRVSAHPRWGYSAPTPNSRRGREGSAVIEGREGGRGEQRRSAERPSWNGGAVGDLRRWCRPCTAAPRARGSRRTSGRRAACRFRKRR